MPQLDKLSFATQYFWLTLFFFGLYFLSVNFFVILVFKNLKLRNIIYKIWYFFLYKFDYADYNNKHKVIVNNSFNFIYYSLYINFFILSKINMAFGKTKIIINKMQLLNQTKDLLTSMQLYNDFATNSGCLIKKPSNKLDMRKLNIDEI